MVSVLIKYRCSSNASWSIILVWGLVMRCASRSSRVPSAALVAVSVRWPISKLICERNSSVRLKLDLSEFHVRQSVCNSHSRKMHHKRVVGGATTAAPVLYRLLYASINFPLSIIQRRPPTPDVRHHENVDCLSLSWINRLGMMCAASGVGVSRVPY